MGTQGRASLVAKVEDTAGPVSFFAALETGPQWDVLQLDLDFSLVPVFAAGRRAASMAWVCRATFCCRCAWQAASALLPDY